MSDLARGVMFSILTVIFGVLTSMLVKELAQELSIIRILIFRFWFALPILILSAFLIHKKKLFFVNNKLAMALRVILGLSSITLVFLALQNISLGLATALFQSSIIFVTLASPVLLGEKIGVYRWSAVVIGMIGVLLITNPFSSELSVGIIYGILAAFTGAALSIILRKLGKSDSPFTITLIHNFFGAFVVSIVGLTIFPTQLTASHEGNVWLLLLILGILASFLQLSVTLAYRYADAVVVTTLRYLQLPAAGIAGFLYFSETPTSLELIGASAIFASSLVIVWREFVRKTVNTPEETKIAL